jgi:hypothetical protein
VVVLARSRSMVECWCKALVKGIWSYIRLAVSVGSLVMPQWQILCAGPSAASSGRYILSFNPLLFYCFNFLRSLVLDSFFFFLLKSSNVKFSVYFLEMLHRRIWKWSGGKFLNLPFLLFFFFFFFALTT